MARVLSAVVFIPILLLIIWRGAPLYFSVLMLVVAVLGLLEYKNIAAQVGMKVGATQSILATVGVLAGFYFQRPDLIVVSLAALVIVELSGQLFTSQDLTKSL